MGVLSGLTVNLFRRDAAGESVFAPFGSLGGVYRVTPEQGARIERETQIAWGLSLATLPVVQTLFGWRVDSFVWLPFLLLGYLALVLAQLRRLERLPISARDLPVIGRAELFTRQSLALGSRMAGALTLVGVAFTIAGGAMIVLGAGPPGYLVAGFFGLCTVVLFAQWRRARAATSLE